MLRWSCRQDVIVLTTSQLNITHHFSIVWLGLLKLMVWVNYIDHKPKITALFPLWVNNIHCDPEGILSPQWPSQKFHKQRFIEYRYRVRKTWVLIPAESFTTSMKLGKSFDSEASLFSYVNGENTTTYLGL